MLTCGEERVFRLFDFRADQKTEGRDSIYEENMQDYSKGAAVVSGETHMCNAVHPLCTISPASYQSVIVVGKT